MLNKSLWSKAMVALQKQVELGERGLLCSPVLFGQKVYLDDWHVKVQSERTPQKGPMEACLRRAWTGECGIWEAEESRSAISRQPDLHSKFLASLGCIVRSCFFAWFLRKKEEEAEAR